MTSGGGCQMNDAEAVIGCREAKNTTGWRDAAVYAYRKRNIYSWFYDFSILRSSGIKFLVCRSITVTYRKSSTTVANFFFK